MNSLINTNYSSKFFTTLVTMLGLFSAILAIVAANPNLPAYESSYLIALMSLILTVSMLINQRLRNPFVDILHVVFFLFYVLRAVALLIFPLSSDLLNPPLEADAVFHATIFLILAFVALVFGSQLFFRRQHFDFGTPSSQEISIIRAILWISTAIVLMNIYYYATRASNCINVYQGFANPVLEISHAVFDSWRVLFFLTPILVLYRNFLSKSYWLLAAGNLIMLAGIGFYMGSKSSVFQIALYFLFPLVLKLRSSSRINFPGLFFFSLFSFVAAAVGFLIGKAMRVVQLDGSACDSGVSKLSYLKNFYRLMKGDVITENMDVTLPVVSAKQVTPMIDAISYRTGYFDFFVERFSNPSYLDVVTFKQYAMAVIDKLTPGFDVFNVPFISRTIYFAHHPGSVPGPMTNSEQITLFGEAWLLFGWGALLYLPLGCWVLGRLYFLVSRLFKNSGLTKTFAALFVLQLFYYWIEGMGLDMLFIIYFLHTGIFILGVLLLAWFFVAATKLPSKWQKIS